MNQKKELDKVKERVIKTYYLLHTHHKDYNEFYLLNNKERLIPLFADIKKLLELDDTLNKKFTKRLLERLDEGISGSIKNSREWYMKLYADMEELVVLLGVERQKQHVMFWGKFWFSEIFPKTWMYLKESVPHRHHEFNGKELPDLKVHLSSSTPSMLLNQSLFKMPGLSQMRNATYRRGFFGKGKILIDLTMYDPQKKSIKDLKDVMKLLKHIDSMPNYRSTLVHEYEHFLQDKGIPMLKAFKSKAQLPETVGVKRSFFKHLLFKFKPLNYFYTKLNDDARELTLRYKLGDYYFRPDELEARLTEMILHKVNRHDEKTILKIESVLPDEIARPINELKKQLIEWEKKKKELEGDVPKKQGDEKKELKKQIDDAIWRIALLKQVINDYSHLFEEAERVANKIIEERKK